METKFLKILIKFSLILLFGNNLSASTINGSQLKTIVESWLENNGKEANISILDELKYPECDSSKMIINDISGNSKLIKVNCFGENPWQFIVRNKIGGKKKAKKLDKSIEVFALKNFKDKGTIISEEDLMTINKKRGITNIFITDKSEIIGKKLKKKIKPKEALRYSNLTNDWLIEKNSLVTIVNNRSFVTIKEEGLAMNNANYMEKIKVKNIKSGKIIVGYAKNQKKVIINTKQN